MTKNRFERAKDKFDSLIQLDPIRIKQGAHFQPLKNYKVPEKLKGALNFDEAEVYSNDVDTNIPGEYKVLLKNIKDSVGNPKFTAEYVVIVVKLSVPEPAPNVISSSSPDTEDEYVIEKTKQFQFTLRPSVRKKLDAIYKKERKRSASSYLDNLIDNIYNELFNDQ